MSNFALVHIDEWDPTAFSLQMTFDKAMEKRKPTASSPMTYINIIWHKYRGKRLIIITSKEQLFSINRRKDQQNKEIELDSWTLRWRHLSSVDDYMSDDERRMSHQKFEQFDAEMQRQIEQMNDAAGKPGARKQKERAYMGLLRTPESLNAEYLYTSGQLMFDQATQTLKDFTLFRVNCTSEEWDSMRSKDLPVSDYSKEKDKYQFLYTNLENVKKGYMSSLPDKNQFKDLIPNRSSGVLYIEIFSVGFTSMMISVTPKIHRCLFYAEETANSINCNLGDLDSHEPSSPVTATAPVQSISVFGEPLPAAAPTNKRKAEEEDHKEEEPEAKKPKTEEPAATAPAPDATPAPSAAPAVKVPLTLNKPSSSSSSSSSSAKPASTTKTASTKPSSSSGSSGATAAKPSSSSSGTTAAKKPAAEPLP